MNHMFEIFEKEKNIIFISLCYSVVIFLISPINLPLDDSALFADIGKNLLTNFCFCSNNETISLRPPGFPLTISFFMFISGAFFIKTLLAFFSFFNVLISFRFAHKFTKSKKNAYVSAILIATMPLVFYNSLRLLSDIPFLVLVNSAFLMFLYYTENKKQKYLFFWAIVTALSIFFRFTGIILILIFFSYFLISRIKLKEDIRMTDFLIFLTLLLLILTPWTLWRFSVGKVSEIGVLDAISTNSYSGKIDINIEAFENNVPVNKNPINFSANVPVQVIIVIRIIVSIFLYLTPLVLISFMFDIFAVIKRFKVPENYLLYLWVFGFLFFHSLYPIYFGTRYILPISLPLAIIFANTIIKISEKKKILFSVIISIQLITSLTIIYADSQTRWTAAQTYVFKESGEWLKLNTPDNSKIYIMGLPGSAMAYYAERLIVSDISNADYIVESNYSSSDKSILILSKNLRLKRISDDKYYVNIYQVVD